MEGQNSEDLGIIFKEYYDSILQIAKKSKLSHNPEYEIIPAMYTVCGLATVTAGKDRNIISNALLQEIKNIYPNLDMNKLNRRCKLYSEILGGKRLRAEWAMGNDSSLYNTELTMCAALLGDILYNPNCAEDYDHAPTVVSNIFDLVSFGADVITPIGQEFLYLFMEIFSS